MQKVFSIYDSKAEAYMQPFVMHKKGEALRAFQNLIKDSNTSISQYPEDYTLFEIGEWDQDNALLTSHATPHSLGVALEYVNKEN